MSFNKLPAIVLLLFFSRSVTAQNASETRSYIKSFPAGRETSLEVSNKYGTIQVTSWDKDSVLIKAEIKAVASNQEKLASMFDGLSVTITGAGKVIRAQTNFGQNFSRMLEGFKGMTSKVISYDSKVEINYYISVPEYLNLKIENKYGDVYMENSTGKLSVSLSNGSFKANAIGKESEITISFCDASISAFKSGSIDASFSEISADELGKVSINSLSSKYDIKKAEEISFNSRRDKFRISNVESLTGNSYFTEYDVENLGKEISLTTRYGNLDVELIDNGFESINLNSGYTDISLRFAETSSYSFDIRHINTFLVLPSKNIITDVKPLNEEKKEYITYGTVGSNQGSAKVSIDAARGKIYMK